MTKLDEMKEQIDLYDEIYPIEINIVETLIQIAEAAFRLNPPTTTNGYCFHCGRHHPNHLDTCPWLCIQSLKKELGSGT